MAATINRPPGWNKPAGSGVVRDIGDPTHRSGVELQALLADA
jgi:hypothetical protein